MKATWEESRTDPLVCKLGFEYASNRWKSWSDKMEAFMPSADILCMVCLYIILTRNVVTDIRKDLPGLLSILSEKDAAELVEPEGAEPLDLRAIREAHRAEERLRFRKTGGSILVVTQVLCNLTTRKLAIGMKEIPGPVENRMLKDITSRKTVMGPFECNVGLACHDFDEVLLRVFAVLDSTDFVQEVGFVPSSDVVGHESLREDKMIAKTFFELSWRLVGKEITSLSFYCKRPPFCFIAAFRSQAKYTEVMVMVRKLWEMLEKLEPLIGAEYKAVQDALADALWPGSPLVRECLVGAAETNFARFSTQTERDLRDVANSSLTSVPCESEHRALNVAQRTSVNGKLGRTARWHAAFTSGVLESIEQVQPIATAEDKIEGKKRKINNSTFEADEAGFSLGKEALQHYISDKDLGFCLWIRPRLNALRCT